LALTRSSLSADTKDALARDVPAADHCRSALRAGLAYFGGVGARGTRVVRTRRASIARLMRSLGDERDGNVRRSPEARLYRNTVYDVDIAAMPATTSNSSRRTRKRPSASPAWCAPRASPRSP
jgi:hypothetical protein